EIITCFMDFTPFFFLMIRPHPLSTLFPYTTLFRSNLIAGVRLGNDCRDEALKIVLDTHSIAKRRERSRSIPAEVRDRVSIENDRSEEHTSELQSRGHLVCRLLLEKKK